MIAAALKNKDVISSGLANGITGNYICIAYSMWLVKLRSSVSSLMSEGLMSEGLMSEGLMSEGLR